MRHVPRLAAWAASCLAFVLAWLMLQPRAAPMPTGPFIPGFSAARAQGHVEALAQAPRPAGSRANARARDYLLARIRALGLEPEVQVDTVSATSWDWMSHGQSTMATARNTVVRKPGLAHGGAVPAMAHYDTGPATPGAADGGASAAALLEAMRALQAGPPLDNDPLFVFTDADAVQAMGARAFMQSPPWAEQVRVALRFDDAGNRGPLEPIGAAHADDGARWQLAAFLLVPATVFIALQRRVQQRLGVASTALGVLLVADLALVATCVRAPGANYVLACRCCRCRGRPWRPPCCGSAERG